MIRCPNCRAELEFNVETQYITCKYCKSTFEPHEFEEKINTATERTFGGKCYLCSSCGAELMSFDETAITFCSYCGLQSMIESKMKFYNNPDFIIPFKKTKEECIKAYLKKISKSLFVPSYMKRDVVVERFRGIYMPYCVYKLEFHGKCINKGTKFDKRYGDYLYYNNYKVTADADIEYDGISFDMISNFYDKFSHSIPHDYKEAEPFNPNYLAGFYTDAKNVDSSLYEAIAENIVNLDSANHMSKQNKFSYFGCDHPKVKLQVSSKKIGMFPIYFLAVRDKKNKYLHYAAINGQTGKVAMDLPIDFKKYLIISILLTIPIFLLINNFFVILPYQIFLISIIASILCIIITNNLLNKIYRRANHLDDIGYIKNKDDINYIVLTKTKNKNLLITLVVMPIIILSIIYFFEKIQYTPPPFFYLIMIIFIIYKLFKNSKKSLKYTEVHVDIKINKEKIKIKRFKYLWASVLALIVAIAVFIINSPYDIYYYGASIIIFGLIIYSFSCLIKVHNMLVSAKLPQLEKRGGRRNEK